MKRNWFKYTVTAATVAAIAVARPAKAGIFQLFGTAGEEFIANWPTVLAAITYGSGPILVVIGLLLWYKDRKQGAHGGHGYAMAGATAIVVGCCIMGIVAFSTEGVLTFTGGSPDGATGAPLTW